MAVAMIDKVEQSVEGYYGVMMAALVILQLLIVPVLGWVGTTLWDIRDRINETSEATAILESSARQDHQRYERRHSDFEERIRALERNVDYPRR